MNKIPVWKTIRFAYTFTFGDIGTIIGLIWLPTVLIAVLQFVPYALGIQSIGQNEAPSQGTTLVYLGCFSASWLLYAMNVVAVTRRALGTDQEVASIHFALGWPEWRIFAAFMLFGLVFLAFYIVYLLGYWLLSSIGPGGSAAAVLLFSTAWLCGLIYVGLRLGMLLTPVVIVEETVDLARVWHLAKGNFWRILAVLLAVLLPLAAIQFGAMLAIVGTQVVGPLPAHGESMQAAINASVAVLDKYMPELIGLSLLLAPFSMGLLFGATAAAYRALAPRERLA